MEVGRREEREEKDRKGKRSERGEKVKEKRICLGLKPVN